jgi:hypothetical protein
VTDFKIQNLAIETFGGRSEQEGGYEISRNAYLLIYER